MSIILFSVLLGFRDSTVGNDTSRYLDIYNSFEYIDFNKSEYGYDILQYIGKSIGLEFYSYNLVLSIFISISFLFFFNKYSTNLLLCIFLHITIGLFAMSMSGIRQTLAVCLGMLAFDLINEKRNILAMLLLYMAFTIHNSSIIVCLPYLLFVLSRKKTKLKYISYLLLSLIPFFFLLPLLVRNVDLFLPQRYLNGIDVYKEFNSISPMLIISWGVLLLLSYCLVLFKISVVKYNYLIQIFFILSIFHCYMMLLGLEMVHLSRLSYYFRPYLIVLIVLVIDKIPNLSFRLVTYSILFILSLYQFVVYIPNSALKIDKYLFISESFLF
ncbi:EpsG family protein [Halosquirtibacter xylanolyticus]|uniref:EpsG family protein n=1 Tax=Halosquirtibacter xylanolyticus TaxID=3374599 RepID=UPI0037493130|nr:EpsG family protein [Prolixibacteraceae bacterium]